ncbi:MAG: BPSS1187 family protein, partial [Limisphaerales bacterium]
MNANFYPESVSGETTDAWSRHCSTPRNNRASGPEERPMAGHRSIHESPAACAHPACVWRPTAGIWLALALVVFLCGPIQAQLTELQIKPDQTDPAIEMVHGPDVAVHGPETASNHRLFLFIGGTGSNPLHSLRLDRIIAGWGYHAVSVDYENNLITVALAHSHDPASFGQYRDAITTGAPVSNRIKVSRSNSILNRFQKLLVYLVKHDPNGGWGEFMNRGQPAWNRIIVAGHSQGSGHAAYIGKMFRVERVLIFSGPQDYLDDLQEPAPWLGSKSATPPSRFFAFLSK